MRNTGWMPDDTIPARLRNVLPDLDITRLHLMQTFLQPLDCNCAVVLPLSKHTLNGKT